MLTYWIKKKLEMKLHSIYLNQIVLDSLLKLMFDIEDMYPFIALSLCYMTVAWWSLMLSLPTFQLLKLWNMGIFSLHLLHYSAGIKELLMSSRVRHYFLFAADIHIGMISGHLIIIPNSCVNWKTETSFNVCHFWCLILQ